MPKLKTSLETKLNEIVFKYSKTYENIGGKKPLYCKHCSKSYGFTEKHGKQFLYIKENLKRQSNTNDGRNNSISKCHSI